MAENPWVQMAGPPAEIAARLVQLGGYLTPQRTGLLAGARSLGDIAAAEGDVGHAFMEGPSHLAQAENRYSIGSPGFERATTGSEKHPEFDAALRTAFDLMGPGTGELKMGGLVLAKILGKLRDPSGRARDGRSGAQRRRHSQLASGARPRLDVHAFGHASIRCQGPRAGRGPRGDARARLDGGDGTVGLQRIDCAARRLRRAYEQAAHRSRTAVGAAWR